MMKRLIWIMVLTVMFSGCTDKGSSIKVVDDSIKDDIKIEKILERVNSESGLKELQITGTNESREYMKLRYRVVWFDKDGFEIKSISENWREFPVYKNADFTIHVVAPNEKAVNYRLFINK